MCSLTPVMGFLPYYHIFSYNEYTVVKQALNLPFIHGPFWLFQTQSRCVWLTEGYWLVSLGSVSRMDQSGTDAHVVCAELWKHMLSELLILTHCHLLEICINAWMLSLYGVWLCDGKHLILHFLQWNFSQFLWHFCMCVCLLSHFSRVWLLRPKDCSLPGSSVHGILQARILEEVAISFFKGSSWPKDRTRVS